MPDKKYHIQLGTTYDVWDSDRWEREGAKYMKDNPTAEVYEESAYDPADEAENDAVFINGMPVEKYVAQYTNPDSDKPYDWKADASTDKRRVRHVPYWKNMAEQQESAMKGMDPNSEQYATASAEYEKNPYVVKVREQEKILNADAELYYGIRDLETQLADMDPSDERYASLAAERDEKSAQFAKSPYSQHIKDEVAKSEKEWERNRVLTDELTTRLAGVQQAYGQLNANDPEFKELKKEEKAILAQLEANPYYKAKQEYDVKYGKVGADALKANVDAAQKVVDDLVAEKEAKMKELTGVRGFFNVDRDHDRLMLDKEYGPKIALAKKGLKEATDAYNAHPYAQVLKEYKETYLPNLRAQIQGWKDAEVDEDLAATEQVISEGSKWGETSALDRLALTKIYGDDKYLFGREALTEANQFDRALAYIDLAEEIRTKGDAGFGGGLGYWAEGMAGKLSSQSDLDTYAQLYGIYKRLEKELGNLDYTEEDLEAHLSHSEQALLLSYVEYLKARQEMGDDLSWWFKAGEMLGEAIPFMVEMFATGGFSGAADDAVKGLVKTKLDNVFARWFGKAMEKKAGKIAFNFLSDALSGAAGTLTAAAIDTVLAPTTYSGIAESMIQIKEDGTLSDSVGDIVKATASQYGERLSEKMGQKAFGLGPFGRAFGDIMEKYPKFATKLTGLPMVKFGKALVNNEFVQDVISLGEGAGKFMRKFGQDGVIAEIGEELWKACYDEVLGINMEAMEQFFDEDNFVPMALSFIALNGARPAVTVVELGYANSKKLYLGAKVDKTLRARLTDEQADYIMAQFEKAETPQEMYDAIKAVTLGLAQAGASQSEIDEVWSYAENEARYKTLVYAKAYNEGEVAQAKRQEIEADYGGRFWMLEEEAPETAEAAAENEAEGEATEAKPEEKKPEKVQMAVLNNGQMVFVLAEADEAGDFPILDVNTKRKGKANLTDIKISKETGKPISRTWDMQHFLTMQVAKDTKAKDEQRMTEEKKANIAKVTESVMADPVLNLGTEAAPNYVRVQSTDENGVVAIDENGNEISLTWEQVGDMRDIRVKPMTRLEIAEKEVEEYAKRQSERIKARGGASEISDAADFVSRDAEAASEYIPTNPDGSVDEKAFWENDPEGWAKWNDKQNEDDGADTLQQIEAAKAEINALLAEARKGMKTSDPNMRKLAKAKAVELEERLARMEKLELQYSPEAQAEKRLQEWEKATGVKFTRLYTLADVAAVDSRALTEATTGGLRAFMHNGKPYIYMQGLSQRKVKGAAEADEIFVHEAVAHSGLKGLLGQRAFDELCEQVWEMMSTDARRVFIAYPNVHGDHHAAADEYIAHVAEKMGANVANYAEKTIWEKIIAFIRKALRAMGMNLKLTEAELSDLLQMAYADLAKNVQAESQRADAVIKAEQRLPAEVRQAIAVMETNKLTPEEQKATTANDVKAAQEAYDKLMKGAPTVEMGETTEEYIARKKAYNDQLDAAQKKLRHAQAVAEAVMEKHGEKKKEEVEKKNGKAVIGSDFRPSVVMTAEEVAAPRSLEPSIIGDENAPIAETDGNGSIRFSTLSYEQGGRDYLVNWLAKEKYMEQDEKDFIVATLDQQYAVAKELGKEFPVFGAWSSAEVNLDEDGNPVMSVIKNNGDYAMNLDFSLICKKRRPLNALLDVMIADRMLDMRQLDEQEIATINKVIQRHGFEVACALCFVDSKRYRVVKVAKGFADMYNKLVESLIPAGSDIVAYESNYAGYEYINERNAQKTGRDLSTVPASELNWEKVDELLKGVKRPKSVEQKIAWALRKNASQRRLVNATDFVTNLGFESVKKNNPELLKIYNSKKGTGGPKASFGDVQYLNDILKSGKFTADKAAQVGGVRIQSFSDYMGHMFFDYMQMVAELSAKGLTAHAYTKEEAFARIFGMTGIKINMSLVPAVAKDGVAAGLDAEGNYVWAVPYTDEQGNEIQGQTFPPEVAFELQKDPRYSGNLGVIAVGVSDAHILKMLNDENIHFVIPYHKSSLNPIVAKMTGIDQYEDYTDVQNERLVDKPQYANLESKQKTNIIKKRKFDFYGSLARTNDPKETAKEYLEHCRKNDLVPKYEAFSKHENYYKLLADFNLYDFVTGEYAPQAPVKMNFPEELNDLVRASVAHNEQLESDLKDKVGKMAEDVKAELGGLRYSTIKEVNNNFNEELQQLIEGKLPEGHVFQMGLPSANLLSTGIPNLPIALQSATLLKKAGDRFHQYELSDIKDLVNHIQKPWAIFAYGDSQKAQNLIVGITKGNKQFLVGLSLNPTVNGQTLNINSIRNVFPKDNHEWLNWVQQGKLLRVDEKEKIQDIINALRINPVDYVNIDLDSVAKIVENFENPTLGNNFSHANLRMSTRMDESQQGDLRFSVAPHESSMDEVDSMFNQYNGDPFVRDLYGKVSELAHTMGLKISFAEGLGRRSGLNVLDKIKYNVDYFNSPDVYAQDKAKTLLHELIHSVTRYAIYAKDAEFMSPRLKEAVAQLESIYEEIKNDPAFDGMYGVTSVEEMVSELANVRFRAKLREKNLLQKIVDAIKNLLGIDKGGKALDNLSATLEDMILNFDRAAYEQVRSDVSKQDNYIRFSVNPEVRAEMDGILANAMVDGLFERDADGVHMLAPNGQRSNLDMDTWALARTANFKKWFGDWMNDPENASKVVDENGEPRVVYHQTNASVYINRETGQNWDELGWKEKMEWDERDDWDEYWEEQEFNTFSRVNARTTNEFDGFFFAPEYDEYHEYGERTIPAFLNIKNPASREDYNIDSSKNDAGKDERIRLQNEGFDGVIRMEGDEVDEYIAFEPNQIKSIHNNGDFSESGDIRFSTSMELDERFGDAWRNQQNEDGRHSTQVANTKSTYEKIGNWMKEAGLEGKAVLDASSGLGLGTQALREMGFEVDDVEPFPSENRDAPTFASYDDIDKEYDVVISNAVLNVIPDDWREDVLRKMASVVKDGGKIIINTRPASNISKQGVEGKTRITLDSPSEILVKRGDRIAAYQKGFTSEELADWIKSVLGEGWRVEKATKKNSGISGEGTAVVVKESAGDIRFSTAPSSIDIEAVKGLQLFESMGYDLEGQMKLAEDSVVAALARIKYWTNSKKAGAEQGRAGAQHAFEVAKRQMELLRDVQSQLIDVTYMEPAPREGDEPQNIREYIAQMLTGKNGSRLTPETLEHELGWSASDRAGMKYIVSSKGMSVNELAELIMADAPEHVLRGMESDDVRNEILDFLQSVRTYAEIRDYMANARMAEAKAAADQHNADIDRFKAEFEAREGMTVEQYNEMVIQQMKEARDAWLASAENPAAFTPEEEKDETDVPSDEELEGMTVDEIVNSGKQRIMEQAGKAKDSFMERVFKINARLDKVRAALAAQREYDQTTAALIADMANEMLENGALSKVTRAEIKRIVSAVKNAVGKQDITPYVDRIMDVMIGNQIRNAKNRLKEFLKIKGKKVNSSGVEVQGKLDIEGQGVLAAMKKGMAYDMAKLESEIAEAEDRLFDSSQVISRDAANELAGLYMAQEYMENIKASEAEEVSLRDELDKAQKERRAGRMSREAYREYEKSIVDAVRENRMQRVTAYENLLDNMAERVMSSIAKANALREADKARVERIHHFANSDMEGMPADELKQTPKGEAFWNNSIVQFFLSPLATFDQMLRHFAPKSRDGKGYLWNHFMGGWMKAAENEYTGVRDAHSVLDEKAREVFGKDVKRWSDIFSIADDLPKMKFEVFDAGRMKEYEFTQGNLMYIYMVNKMSDGKMKLRRMGITEEQVEQIAREMDPRLIELADWLQDSFLPSLREKYNAVHERMFGAPMAAIENYFPLVVNQNARAREEDVNNPQGTAKPSTITGAIIKRTKNSAALDLLNADALDVILGHVEQMEHWAAFAEWNRDLNTLLSYKKFRNRLQNASGIYGAGKELWKNFRTAAEIAAGVYQPAGKGVHDKLALNLAKGVTGAKIAFRVYTALKQFLSMPAFVSDSRPDILMKNMANPMGAWNWAMDNLPLFEKRWKSRQAGDSRLMATESDWKMWQTKAVEIAGRVGMTPNAFVDAVTVSIGARSIYETKYRQYLDYGYTEEQAREKAKLDAQVLFNESQQSNEAAFLSQMQVDRTWWTSLLTVFRNSSMGYQRMYVDALRNLGRMMKKGYKDESIEYMKKQMVRDGLTEEQAQRAAERIYRRSFTKNATQAFTFGFLVQFAWNLGPVAVYLLMGDDDDEKWAMLKDAAVRGLVGGPVEGLAAGQLASSLIGNAVMGEKISETDGIQLPAISDLESLKTLWDTERYRALNDLFNLAAQSLVGVNPQTFTDVVTAVVDACDGDMETSKEVMFAVMRILQVPQSQISSLYMDEIDLTADEAYDMTVQEFAERYAKYKMMRNAPLTKGLYPEEDAKAREEKYIMQFLQDMKEKRKTRGSEEAQLWLEYIDTEFKEMGETLRDLKKAVEKAEEGSAEQKAAEDALEAAYESPEYEKYEQAKAVKSLYDYRKEEPEDPYADAELKAAWNELMDMFNAPELKRQQE